MKSVTAHTKTPTDNAVRKTPNVDRVSPCQKTGFITSQRVSSPPEKSMKFNAIMPIKRVTPGLLKFIFPMPSEPASIPTITNRISVGTPRR